MLHGLFLLMQGIFTAEQDADWSLDGREIGFFESLIKTLS